MMELVILTGVSGAGKTVALKTFEDLGYYCVDNLPIFLIPQFAELAVKNEQVTRFAIGVDTRSGKDLASMPKILTSLKEQKIRIRILFLDCRDSVLIKRFKETRRSHPLAGIGRIEDGIRLERETLDWLKEHADVVIDTSSLLRQDLTNQLKKLLADKQGNFRNMVITVMSFGYKYGLPEDADLVFDVRFLPNPFYVEELKEKNGLCREVRDYCLDCSTGIEFMDRLNSMLQFLIPNYIEEGKNQLMIGIGCTGGKHRSVSVAEDLKGFLSGSDQYLLQILHRDIAR